MTKRNGRALRVGKLRDLPAEEKHETSRTICNIMAFWRVCERKACRRARACAGDANVCFGRFWPHVPPENKVRLREGIRAHREGLPLDKVTQRMDAAEARFRAAQCPNMERAGMASAPRFPGNPQL